MTVQLIQGDCLEYMKSMADKSIDAVITDPPYGVNLDYDSFDDTVEYIQNLVVPAITDAIRVAKVCILTPGNKSSFYYPKPDDIGVWYNPAGTGFGAWGFNLAHLILYYGKCPAESRNMASSCEGRNDSVTAIKAMGHPCPKPLKFVKWLIKKGSKEGDTILDPFMGSGTTGVACVQTGRNFIGVEIDPGYFKIAQKRIHDAEQQMRLF